MDNPSDITILSLCAGYGGLEIGLARALENPLRVVAVEIEAYALANLVAKTEEGKLAIEALYPDVKTFPAERFSGCFDIILAGFPCQPFSVAGKRQGGLDPRHLWPHIERIISAVRPVHVFLENVPGLLSARTLDNRPDLQRYLAELYEIAEASGPRRRWYLKEHIGRLNNHWLKTEGVPAFASIYFSLQDLGYKVEQGMFTAAEVGAPHKRQRLFILAHSERAESRLRIRQEPQAEHQRRQGQPGNNAKELQALARSCDLWPARPGQPQYEWEEPRVVEHPGSPTPERLSQPEGRDCDREVGNSGGQGQAEPIVGRAVNGPSRRVDRLRLLGNGVVRQQAAKAFRELIKRWAEPPTMRDGPP